MSETMELSEKLAKGIEEALKKGKKRNFKQSVEMIVVFRELDPRKPESRLRETIVLPNPPKKPQRICVVAEGDTALAAKNAGVERVIGKSELEELAKDRKKARKVAKECDWVLIQTDLMPIAGRALGPVLGPRGKIPVPLPPRGDVTPIIERYRRAVLIRIKDQPQIQARIGTEDNSVKELVENAQAVLQVLEHKFKSLHNISRIYIKKTMSPPVEIRLR
jgi:large subunit ribosomal protein L1